MERTAVHFMFLCFVLIASLSQVASEHKLYSSWSLSKYAGVQYVQSADVREIDVDYLLNNQCKFFVVEKTIFYACPKRPTRYPFLDNEVIRDGSEHNDRGGVQRDSQKFECPFPFGTYPHPKDCRKYYLCIFDKPRIMTCDASMLYDEYQSECAKKNTVDCGDRTGGITTKGTTRAPGQKTTTAMKTTTKKVQKFKCPYTWGTFPNPEDCSQYYLCLNKRHTLKKCKPTELYDTGKNECRDEDEVDCASRFNPREKTTKPPATTAFTTARPTTSVTTTKEEITSYTFEKQTSQSSSEDTSDQGATEYTPSIEISPSSGPKTTLQDDTESTNGKLTSEQPAQSTEEPSTTDDNSETDKPEPTSENPRITNDVTLDTEKPEVTDDTSESDQPKPTSEKHEFTNGLDTSEPELTSDESSEATGTTSKPTKRDSSVSQEPDITDNKSTTSGKFDTTDKGSDPSEEPVTTVEDNSSKEPQFTEDVRTAGTTENEESTAPGEETSPTETFPDDNTNSDDEKSTNGEGEISYTTEKASTSSQPESTVNEAASSEEPHSPTENKIPYSTPYVVPDITDADTETSEPETTADAKVTPEVSQSTVDSGEISSSSDEIETSLATSSEPPEAFVCPKKKANFPHKDCSLYYACRGGAYTIEQCPGGTLFHSIYGMCDEQDNVDCGDRKRPDRDERSTVFHISSASPTDLPMPETTADIEISSEFSNTFDNTDKTVGYTSSEISETTSTSDYTTEKTDSTSDFDNNDLTSTGSTENVETSFTSKTDGMVGTESSSDDETFETSKSDEVIETSESQSTFISSTQEISASGDSTEDKTSVASTENYSTNDRSESISISDYVTKEAISSVDGENTETSPDYSTEKPTYSTEAESETYTTADYSTKDTSRSTLDEISVKTTTEFKDEQSTQNTNDDNEQQSTSEATETTTDLIKEELSTQNISDDNEHRSTSEATAITTDLIKEELSTQSIADDKEHQSTNEATERNITTNFNKDELSTQSIADDSSTEDQSTSFISDATYSDSQEEITIDYTDVSITATGVSSESHNTDNAEETTSTSADEISSTNITALRTGDPSTQSTTDDDEDTTNHISSVGTTAEKIINDLTSSEPHISTEEESTSFTPGTTQSNSDKPVVFETTDTESYQPSETTQGHFTSFKEIASTTKVEIIASTAQPREVCLTTDKTCITDKGGNVFRCPKSHGHFPHPWDMSKFLHCDNFRIHVIDCPAGLRFDPKHNICTWAAAEKE